MTIKEQIKKNETVINEIVNSYFVTDQKLAILKPLLEDENLIPTWGNTPGVRALEALRLTIYMAILSDMRAILFDTKDNTASIENVISAFNNKGYVKAAREKYSKPLNTIITGHDDDPEIKSWVKQQIEESHTAEAIEHFDSLLPETITLFDKLKDSDLCNRVNNARNKMISHKDIRSVDGERGLYNPTEFGLKWGDANDIVDKGKEIIFNINLLISNSSYDLDSFLGGHVEAANSFWSAAKTPIKSSNLTGAEDAPPG